MAKEIPWEQLLPYLQGQLGNMSYGLAPQGVGQWGKANADLAQGELMRQEEKRRKEEEKKKKKSSFLGKVGSVAGTVLGTVIGGPVGGAIGSGVGSAAGQAAGGGGVDWGNALQSGVTSGLTSSIAPSAFGAMAKAPGMIGKIGQFGVGVPSTIGSALGGGAFAQGVGNTAQGLMMQPMLNPMMNMAFSPFQNAGTPKSAGASGAPPSWTQNPSMINAASNYQVPQLNWDWWNNQSWQGNPATRG